MLEILEGEELPFLRLHDHQNVKISQILSFIEEDDIYWNLTIVKYYRIGKVLINGELFAHLLTSSLWSINRDDKGKKGWKRTILKATAGNTWQFKLSL